MLNALKAIIPSTVNSFIAILIAIAIIIVVMHNIKWHGYKSLFKAKNFLILIVLTAIIVVSLVLPRVVLKAEISSTTPGEPVPISAEESQFRLLVPTTVMSIILSVVALSNILFLFTRIRANGLEKIIGLKNLVMALFITASILCVMNFVTIWAYGTLSVTIVNVIVQVILYGFLLPYILVSQIAYIYRIFKGA